MWMAAFLKAEKVFIFILGARYSRKGQAPAKWWNYIHNWQGLPPARGRQLGVGWAPGGLLKGKRQADATASHAEPAWSVLPNSDGLVVKKKKKSACQCGRLRRFGFSLWVKKIPWRRYWQSTPVFLPGRFRGQKSLTGYSPRGHGIGHDWTHSPLHYGKD